jgi:hypothetical protein
MTNHPMSTSGPLDKYGYLYQQLAREVKQFSAGTTPYVPSKNTHTIYWVMVGIAIVLFYILYRLTDPSK